MKDRFADLIDTASLQQLLDRLYLAAGIPVGIIDTDGTIHVATGWQEICTRFHRSHPETAQRCRESDDFISSHLDDVPYAQYRCKNGLWDIAVPIRIEGEHLATLFVGQFHFEDDIPDRTFFQEQADRFGFDREEYLAALDRLPVFSRPKMQAIIDFYLMFVNQLVEEGVNRLKRLQAEKELSRQKALLNSVIEGTDDAIFVKDGAGRYVMVNSEVCRIFCAPREEILGKDDTAFLSAAEAAALMAADREVMNQSGPLTREEVLTTPVGWRVYLATKGAIRDENGAPIGIFGIARDITARKHLEEKVRQSLKMESIGRLAGGVAHDFNNKLTVILGYTELAKMLAPPEGKLAAYLGEVSRAAEHSRNITAQLLAFSRQQVASPQTIDLNAQVREATPLPRLIGEGLRVTCQLSHIPLMVKIDPTQLDQIILNLSANAQDAMPHGGEITISTRPATVDGDFCQHHVDATPGEYAELTFADNGMGMDRVTLAHIFEPFFTTKGMGQRNGLGLATIYGIITQNGGFVVVESEPEEGTRFRIFLPRLADQKERGEIAGARASDGGSVLLVEKDPAVRAMISSMLQSMGYAVYEAMSPGQAIEACGGEAELHILLSDMLLPGLSASELMERLRPLRPGLKALFMSPSPDEDDPNAIRKPFTMQLLSEKLVALLHA